MGLKKPWSRHGILQEKICDHFNNILVQFSRTARMTVLSALGKVVLRSNVEVKEEVKQTF